MKFIDRDLLASLSHEAAASSRRRANRNLHPRLEDPVQRLCNALEPDSYIRPHRHPEADKWELFVMLSGAAAVLSFDDYGRVLERTVLAAEGPVYGMEIPEQTWHTLVALQPGTVALEIKRGPYRALDDKDFAAWAPAEGEAEAAAFLAWFREAGPGAMPPERRR